MHKNLVHQSLLAISYLAQLAAGHHLVVQAASLALPAASLQTFISRLPSIACLLLSPLSCTIALTLAAIHLTTATTVMVAAPRRFHVLDHDGLGWWQASLAAAVLALLVGLPLVVCNNSCSSFNRYACTESLEFCRFGDRISDSCAVETLSFLGPVAVLAVTVALLVAVLVRNSRQKVYAFTCRKVSNFVGASFLSGDNCGSEGANTKMDISVNIPNSCNTEKELNDSYEDLFRRPKQVIEIIPSTREETKWAILRNRLLQHDLPEPRPEACRNQVAPAAAASGGRTWKSRCDSTASFCELLPGEHMVNRPGQVSPKSSAKKEVIICPADLSWPYSPSGVDDRQPLVGQQSDERRMSKNDQLSGDGTRSMDIDLSVDRQRSAESHPSEEEQLPSVDQRSVLSQLSMKSDRGRQIEDSNLQSAKHCRPVDHRWINEGQVERHRKYGRSEDRWPRSTAFPENRNKEAVGQLAVTSSTFTYRSVSFQHQPSLAQLSVEANLSVAVAPSICRRVRVRPTENDLTWMALITGLVLFAIFLLAIAVLVLDRLVMVGGKESHAASWSAVLRYILGLRYRASYLLPWTWFCRHEQLRLYAVRKVRCCLSKVFTADCFPAAVKAWVVDRWLGTTGRAADCHY